MPTFHRLKNANDFKRVRRDGKSHAHPLVVALVAPQSPPTVGPSRVGFVAGRALGKAVQRNRLKRQLRAATHILWPQVTPGWDIIFIARAPCAQASFTQLQAAVAQLLQRARLLAPPPKAP